MTAVQAGPHVVGGKERQLLCVLRGIHAQWLQETRRVLDFARRPEAGIHCRWRAIRYLNTIVSSRFEIERGGVDSLDQVVEHDQAVQPWLAGELMATLAWQLDLEPDLCHRAGEFSVLTHKFENTLARWCGAVEDAFGRLSWDEIPEPARQRFALLSAKEVYHDV